MTPILKVKDLVKVYKGKDGSVTANKNISLTMNEGDTIGILGPNGSGKTTFIRQVIGYLPKTSGSIELFGKTMEENSFEIRKNIGYLMQYRYNHWDHLTTRQALEYVGKLKGMSKKEITGQADELIEQFELKSMRKQMLRNLSGGNKQAVCIAVTLMGTPKLIILDEPSNGLDMVKRNQFWKVLNKICARNKSAILLVSHSAEEIEKVANKIIIFEKGEIITQGILKELKNELLEDIRIEIFIRHKNIIPKIKDLLKIENYITENKKIIFHCHKNETAEKIKRIVTSRLWEEVLDFNIIHPTLEDLYIRIIGKKME